MRIFVTGATGFIGGRLTQLLRKRGDEVVCLVRDPERAAHLVEMGCELVSGDLASREAIAAGCEGADAVIHGAAIYEVGIPKKDREPMYKANVVGTETVLETAHAAGVPRLVYISTVAVFGDTHGEIVDEEFEHPGGSFTSYYEETKYLAHQAAKRLILAGAPVIIAQPGGVYGPNDTSSVGKTLKQFANGRMPAIPFPDLGLTLVHVDDVATGICRCLDQGEIGRAYVLGGEVTTMRGLIETAGEVLGRKPPRMSVPTGMLKALKPFGPLVGAGMGQPPNLGELISSADGVTFWATSDRAREELGYAPRDLSTGLRDTFRTEDRALA